LSLDSKNRERYYNKRLDAIKTGLLLKNYSQKTLNTRISEEYEIKFKLKMPNTEEA
jgi:hypothetical protein